jgi:hypothetical protein
LSLWLKADLGLTNTGDGGTATAWNDFSGNNYNFTDGGASPYVYRESGLNFNPTVDNPDGSDRRFINTGALDVQTVTVVTIPDSPTNCSGPFSELNVDDEAIRTCEPSVGAGGIAWRVPGNVNDFSTGGQGWFNGTSATNPVHNNLPNILTVEATAVRTLTGTELGDSHPTDRYWNGDIAEII